MCCIMPRPLSPHVLLSANQTADGVFRWPPVFRTGTTYLGIFGQQTHGASPNDINCLEFAAFVGHLLHDVITADKISFEQLYTT